MTKGRDTESHAVDLYERAGYETYLPPKAKFREQDVFGWFDILAFGHGRMIGVQCKTNRADGVTEYFGEATVYEEHITDLRVEFLVRFESQGWKLYRAAGSEYTVAFDGREVAETPSPELIEVLQQ